MNHIKLFEDFQGKPDALQAFLIKINALPENVIRDIMGDAEYIDTPGNYDEEKKDYDDVEDYMQQNMGTESYKKLIDWYHENPDKVEKIMSK